MIEKVAIANCPFCKSEKTLKTGKTQARTPKQRLYCKDCSRFFVSELKNSNGE